MPKLTPIAAGLVMAATIASTGTVSAAAIPARLGSDSPVAAQVEGDTYVLLGPNVFGSGALSVVTVCSLSRGGCGGAAGGSRRVRTFAA
jgi:hypothetical protein